MIEAVDNDIMTYCHHVDTRTSIWCSLFEYSMTGLDYFSDWRLFQQCILNTDCFLWLQTGTTS